MSRGTIAAALNNRLEAGGKCLVPYLTAGFGAWESAVEATSVSGADAIELGIPFSDPVMDGPIIQEASELALRAGATPPALLDAAAGLDVAVPLAVMTYYNILFRAGDDRFAAHLAQSQISGAIVPDLPLEECTPWCEAADRAGVETIMLGAPTGSDERLARVCERARGFVYAVGLLGVTGERDQLAASATEIAARLKALTDKPVLIGVGVGSPEQAVEACRVADGVVVGSRIVREMIETGSPEAVGDLVGRFRDALDAGSFD